jgi:hypothetical protein
MQESQDKYLDECINRALRGDWNVTPQQQQRAWENLRRRAAQQTILPPIATPLHVHLWHHACVWSKARLVSFCQLVFDDTAYRRAQYGSPTALRQRRPHSTFASAELMLCA